MKIRLLFLLIQIEVTLTATSDEATISTPTPSNDNVKNAKNVTSSSLVTGKKVSGNGSDSDVALTCSQQCSEQYLSYCTGFSYPLEESLGLSMSCHKRDLQGRDRYVTRYIDSAIEGQWKNMTPIFQELLMAVSPAKEMFPEQYFSPGTAVISVLEGHKMSNTCNSGYMPLKGMICTWMFVSPCQPHFRICQKTCDKLMRECLPTALTDPLARPVINFICHAMGRDSVGCFKPDKVYREDVSLRREHDRKTDNITIISASVAAGVVLITIGVLLAVLRYYMINQGYMSRDSILKLQVFDTGPMRERARDFLSKSDMFPGLRSSNRSLGDKSATSVTFKKRGNVQMVKMYGQQLLDPDAYESDLSLDQVDSFSLNSSASTFYCQTNQSVSTIGEILPPETIKFEGVLSSRWKSSEDEVIALVSWIDGIGNKKKGVIKCYTDKKRKHMEDELNVISRLSNENVCEYFWRSMGNRPHVSGLSPHMQSVMSVRNNYFCTEHYTYGSLKDFLISGGHFLKDTTAQSFTKDIVCGMAYLHELEVFHRDLKTANILVGNRTGKTGSHHLKLVISDFGHSQEKHRQDCYVRDGSGGTSQYTAPEVLLSNGNEVIDLYKADVYSMSLVSWEILSYVCCRHNDIHQNSRHEVLKLAVHSAGNTRVARCQIQHHTAFGTYLLNRFPDISSTSTSSSVVRDYMRNMYRTNKHVRPAISEVWSTVSPIVKNMILITKRMWLTDAQERLSTSQLCQIFNLPRCNSRQSLSSSHRHNSMKDTLSSVLCINGTPT